MQKSQRAEFIALIEALASGFRVTADPALLSAYWLGLSDLPFESVEAAVSTAIRESEFMPRAAELRALAGVENPSERGAQAWSEVMKLARNSRTAEHPDPVVEQIVMRLGGWRRFGMMTEDRVDFMRKDFLDLYKAQAKHGSFKQVTGGECLAIGPGRDQGWDDNVR
jgi:hypothetical protein